MKRRLVAFLLSAAMIVEGMSGLVSASAVDPAGESVVSELAEMSELSAAEETADFAEETADASDYDILDGRLYMTFTDLAEGDYTAVLSADEEAFATLAVSLVADETGLCQLEMDLPEGAPSVFTLALYAGDDAEEAVFETEVDTMTAAAAEDVSEDTQEIASEIPETAEFMAAEDPVAMTAVTATPAEHSFTLTWTAPVVAEETPVASYKVMISGAEILSQTVTDTTATFTYGKTYNGVKAGIKGGQKYTYSVTAYDANGTALTTAATGSVTPKTTAVVSAAPTVTATPGVTSVKLTWNKVSNATAYLVQHSLDGKKYTTDKTVDASTTSYSYSGLAPNSTYYFRVSAQRKVNGVCGEDTETKKNNNYGWKRTVVTTKTTLPTLAASSSLKITEKEDNNYKLTWKKVANATGYRIYLYDYNKEKYKKIATVTGKVTYTAKVAADYRHKFKVVAIYNYKNAAGESKTSASKKFVEKVIMTGKKNLSDSIHSIWYNCTAKTAAAPVYTKQSGGKLITNLKKGTKFTVTYRRLGRCTVKLADGTKGYLNAKFINFKNNIYTKDDYTTEQKEYYVNTMGYESKTEYLLWVSTYTQHLNIFKGSKGKWKLYKTFKCSTGKNATPTHLGLTKIIGHVRKRYNEASFENYMTCWALTTPTGVHGWVRKASTGKPKNTVLGRPMSNGCVRVADENAYWCYTNIKKGTAVVRY